jgi:hypothetical protein
LVKLDACRQHSPKIDPNKMLNGRWCHSTLSLTRCIQTTPRDSLRSPRNNLRTTAGRQMEIRYAGR